MILLVSALGIFVEKFQAFGLEHKLTDGINKETKDFCTFSSMIIFIHGVLPWKFGFPQHTYSPCFDS
jgi:hypothetical protein